MSRGSLGGRGVRGEWIHVYVWLNTFAAPETITTLLISYTPIQNKKSKKKRLGQILSYSTLTFYFINELKIIFYISVFCTRGYLSLAQLSCVVDLC